MSQLVFKGEVKVAPDKKFTEYDVDSRHLTAYTRSSPLHKWANFKETNELGKVGEMAVVDIILNKHEMKTHSAFGKGPSGKGWINTGHYIVEFEAKDSNGTVRPSGIMAKDLDDNAMFWNALEYEGEVIYVAKCKVKRMRRYIQKRLEDPAFAHMHGWWGNGGRAHCMKVPIPETDPEAEEAIELIEAEREKEKKRKLNRNYQLREAWLRYKESRA